MSDEKWFDSIFDIGEFASGSADAFHLEEVVTQPSRKREAPGSKIRVPKRASKQVADDIKSYMADPKPLTHIDDMNRLHEIYSTLKMMRLDKSSMLDAVVDRVWDLRHEWLVSAHVPDRSEMERIAWIHSAVLFGTEDEEGGSGSV